MPVKFDYKKTENPIIKVIGVGGGGCNAVNHMFQQGIEGVGFAVCNTDRQPLEASEIPIKITLGPNLTEGRGAGSRPQIGRQACLESIEEVKSYIGTETKMLFIAAGMGGGTGTGAAPVIAEAAQELGILTIAIVTLPFKFEGNKRALYAEKGIAELKESTDALIIVSNEKLREIHGNLPISNAFSHADNILSSAAKGISEIITVPGYINTDFEDVNTIMRNSGVAIMGMSVAEGQDRATKVISSALNSPLLAESDLSGASDILFHVTSGNKEVTLDEIYEITDYIESEVGTQCNIIWGNSFDESLGEKISITIVATGFHNQDAPVIEEKEKVVEPVPEEVVMTREEGPEFISLDDESSLDVDMIEVRRPSEYHEVSVDKTPILTHDKDSESPVEAAIRTGKARDPYITSGQAPIDFTSSADKKPPSYKNLDELESIPTYVRRKVELEEVPSSKQYRRSTKVINTEGEAQIRDENPYLYDNVD